MRKQQSPPDPQGGDTTKMGTLPFHHLLVSFAAIAVAHGKLEGVGALGRGCRWKTFGFASVETDLQEWMQYDWDKLTTLALVGEGDPDKYLLRHARDRGCKVVKVDSIRLEDLVSSMIVKSLFVSV